MTHAFNPTAAAKMLDLCHEGNKIYEVLYRFPGRTEVYVCYSQYPTPSDAELSLLQQGAITAVAREIER